MYDICDLFDIRVKCRCVDCVVSVGKNSNCRDVSVEQIRLRIKGLSEEVLYIDLGSAVNASLVTFVGCISVSPCACHVDCHAVIRFSLTEVMYGAIEMGGWRWCRIRRWLTCWSSEDQM